MTDDELSATQAAHAAKRAAMSVEEAMLAAMGITLNCEEPSEEPQENLYAGVEGFGEF